MSVYEYKKRKHYTLTLFVGCCNMKRGENDDDEEDNFFCYRMPPFFRALFYSFLSETLYLLNHRVFQNANINE